MKNTALKTALLVLSLMLGATLVGGLLYRKLETNEQRQQFETRADDFSRSVEEVMTGYAQVLRAGIGLYQSSNHVTRSEWKTFVDSLQTHLHFPGIYGLGYAKTLNRDEIENHVRAEIADGRPNFKFHPPGERDFYIVTTYLEPDNWRNRRALGFDMYTDPIRREAMLRAAINGKTNLSHKVKLHQETTSNVQPGTLLYMPLYHDHEQSQRAGADPIRRVSAYIYAVFRMGDLFQDVLRARNPTLPSIARIRVFDGTEKSAETILFATSSNSLSADLNNDSEFSTERSITLWGVTWTIDFYSTRAFDTSSHHTTSSLILMLGTLISGLVAWMFYSLALSKMQIAEQAAALTEKVAENAQVHRDLEIANRELVHRVKNTLAVVQGIMSKTMMSTPDPKDFGRNFSERLQSLARSHDILVAQYWRGVPLKDLISEQLAFVDQRFRFDLSGPELYLTASAAQNLGLALHELATNTLKYGNGGDLAQSITLTWTVADDTFTFTWSEPASQEPTRSRKGFGDYLLFRHVPLSLGGNAHWDYAGGRLSWSVTAPLETVSVTAEADKVSVNSPRGH